MDQEITIDVKALRAKFQDGELPVKQSEFKPSVPTKPKVVPPPQSPMAYVPIGGHPSLLTSINQSCERKMLAAPRVVFKDDKKEMKKSLIQTNSKGKDKSEVKLKGGKDSKAKADANSLVLKVKKGNGKDKKLPLNSSSQKESTEGELVPATPPPKSATMKKKKGLLDLIKSSKRDSAEIPTDPILDSPSVEAPGPDPLIPIPSDSGNPEPELSVPEMLLLNSQAVLDPNHAETYPSSSVPESPAFIPPPVFIPDIPVPDIPVPDIPVPEIPAPEIPIPEIPVHEIPAPEIPTTDIESRLEVDGPTFPVLRPNSQIEIIPPPPSPSPLSSPPPPPLVASTPSPTPPEPKPMLEPDIEAVISAALEKPPAPPVVDPPSGQTSPAVDRSISVVSALDRAEDMSLEKKRTSVDQRIFSALQKARRKTTSSLVNPTPPLSSTPPPEEFPPSNLLDLPPIDYDGGAHRPETQQVNDIDPGPTSPELGATSEQGLVFPSLPSQDSPVAFVFPDVPPEKPTQLPSVNLGDFTPPHLGEDNGLAEFSGTDTTDIPEFDDLTPDAPSLEVPPTEWGDEKYPGPDSTEGGNLPAVNGNGIVVPGSQISPKTLDGDEYQNHLLALPRAPGLNDSPPGVGPPVENGNGPYNNADLYEDVGVSMTKKKAKTEGGKKSKGRPKNPYAEGAQEPNQEKTKTGRFGKTDKKSVEGPDDKELKKREKQRLEKEKKELKEKQEREKKEQKEREKKESELKKKFKITGQEDAIYKANVIVTTKGRKNDLLVKSGEVVSIIRTTNCPKGKWLARDCSNNYGYVAVDHVELDIQEMLELGRKARKPNNNVAKPDATGTGNGVSNHFPTSGESFEDDSEEWNDDDELVSPATDTADPPAFANHTGAPSRPDMSGTANKELGINHQHSQSDIHTDSSQSQSNHEALQKLATIFRIPKAAVEPTTSNSVTDPTPTRATEEAAQASHHGPTQGMDFEHADMLILPPPDLYADLTLE